MSAENLTRLAESAAEDAGYLAGYMRDAWMGCLGEDAGAEPGPEPSAEVRAAIWELRRVLRLATIDGGEQQLASALRQVAQHGPEIRTAIVHGVDLVETLVQAAERGHGRGSGQGRLKAAEVKSALQHLARHARIPIAGLPPTLQPVLVDAAISWSIDSVVHVSNRYGLWVEERERVTIMGAVAIRVGHFFMRLLSPLWYVLAWLASRFWYATHERAPLSKEVRAAVVAIERDPVRSSFADVFGSATRVLIWLGENRPLVVATLDVVTVGVEEAERYTELSGPQKKAYASALVLAVLGELGFKERAGLLLAIVGTFVDGAIDSTVHLFNKRGVFEH